MNKFTIFTVILAVSVITVTADLVLRDYFGPDNSSAGEASTLTPPDIYDVHPDAEKSAPSVKISEIEQPPIQPVEIQPEEEKPYVPPPPSMTITQGKLNEAGFNAVLSEKHFNGRVYQLLDITKSPVEAMGFYEVVQDNGPIATITEISLKDEIRALQMYTLLQNKTKTYIDLSLNETNAYGDRSFYINHAKKPSEAFLTVKIGRMIYAFAYVKTYHPELKNLIQILAQ